MSNVLDKSENDSLKYRKLYNWAHTLILSGVIKDGEKFPSEHVLEEMTPQKLIYRSSL